MNFNTCPECRGNLQENVEQDGLVCMRCGGLFLYHQGGKEFDHDEAYTARDRRHERHGAFRVRYHTHPEDAPPAPVRRYRPRG